MIAIGVCQVGIVILVDINQGAVVVIRIGDAVAGCDFAQKLVSIGVICIVCRVGVCYLFFKSIAYQVINIAMCEVIRRTGSDLARTVSVYLLVKEQKKICK